MEINELFNVNFSMARISSSEKEKGLKYVSYCLEFLALLLLLFIIMQPETIDFSFPSMKNRRASFLFKEKNPNNPKPCGLVSLIKCSF